MDISASMLANALDREVAGDLFLADMGAGVPFRAGVFDAAVSISAIQWLCNADRADAEPKRRLAAFFGTLFAALKRGGKVCCQFYPTSQKQTDAILSAAKTAGFGGGLVVDDPESKKNTKYYLVLTAGQVENEAEQINLAGVTMDEAVRRSKKTVVGRMARPGKITLSARRNYRSYVARLSKKTVGTRDASVGHGSKRVDKILYINLYIKNKNLHFGNIKFIYLYIGRLYIFI